MRSLILRSVSTTLLLAALPAGCAKLGLGGPPPHSTQLPTAREVKTIRYMAQTAGPDGRRVYSRLDEAKSCHDLEIAMRWNRPPDLRGGPFNQKMVYFAAGVPSDLAKNSEVYLAGRIKAGRSLPAGGSIWSLKLADGSEVQAIETPEYTEKQDEDQQAGGHATMIHPYAPGRMLCAYGIYQGNIGMALSQHGHVPLVSVLFAMDRYR